MISLRPTHKRYVFHALNDATYHTYMNAYSKSKRLGIRGVYAWASGVGVYGVFKDAVKGTVVQYGKEKFAVFALMAAGYIQSPVVCFLSNATTVVNGARRVHSICAFAFECIEDSGNLVFICLDVALFGQPVPVGNKHRFDIIGNFTNIFGE